MMSDTNLRTSFLKFAFNYCLCILLTSPITDIECRRSPDSTTKHLSSSLPNDPLVPECETACQPYFDAAPLREIAIENGQSLDLSCPAMGKPPPDIEWFKDGAPLRTRLYGQSIKKMPNGDLRLPYANFDSDQGNYVCKASNSLGTILHSTAVVIFACPNDDDACSPYFRRRPFPEVQLRVLNGETIKLTCPAAGRPRPNIAWFKDGTPLLTRHRHREIKQIGEELQLPRSMDHYDDGIYKCVANNSEGSIELSVFVKVTVPSRGILMLDPPQNQSVIEGASVSVAHNTRIDPQLIPTIDWYKCHFKSDLGCDWIQLKGTSRIMAGSSHLTINEATIQDSGYYMLEISANGALKNATFWIEVKSNSNRLQLDEDYMYNPLERNLDLEDNTGEHSLPKYSEGSNVDSIETTTPAGGRWKDENIGASGKIDNFENDAASKNASIPKSVNVSENTDTDRHFDTEDRINNGENDKNSGDSKNSDSSMLLGHIDFVMLIAGAAAILIIILIAAVHAMLHCTRRDVIRYRLSDVSANAVGLML